MNIPPELLPVVQITLPLLIGGFIAVHVQNKRLDDIMRRLERIEERLNNHGERLAAIETLLRSFGERIARLEERLPPMLVKER